MPNRIIKETIRTNKAINSLTDFQFRMWTYLLTYVDDYGRGSAEPDILKGFVFPRRKSVTEKNISDCLTDLACMGLIDLYEVDGESYLCFPTWADHQRIQQKRSKFPGPDSGSRKSPVSHGESPPESESNPNTNQNQNPNPNPNARARGDGAFDRFWAEYPKKVGKGQAQKAFSKISVPVETLIEAVQRQKNSVQWQKDGGQYIPNPATWLNQKRWEDDLDSLNMGGGVTHGGAFPNSGPIIEKLPAASDGWWDD